MLCWTTHALERFQERLPERNPAWVRESDLGPVDVRAWEKWRSTHPLGEIGPSAARKSNARKGRFVAFHKGLNALFVMSQTDVEKWIVLTVISLKVSRKREPQCVAAA